jgi:hypothetical protein
MSTEASRNDSEAFSSRGLSLSQHASKTDPKHDSTQGATSDPSVSFEVTEVVGSIKVTKGVEVTSQKRKDGWQERDGRRKEEWGSPPASNDRESQPLPESAPKGEPPKPVVPPKEKKRVRKWQCC